MRALRSATAAVAVMTTATALAGCGSSARDAVRAKVDQFEKATASKDYKTLCTQVLAPNLLAHLSSSGLGCERGLAIGFGNVQHPQLAIGSITVHGKTASVTVLTTATKQEGALTAIELSDTSNGWRITGLGSPEFPKKTT